MRSFALPRSVRPAQPALRRWRALCVVGLLALIASSTTALAAAPGFEQTACDDDMTVVVPTTTRMVLPCAMADSGVLAPDCLDAVPFVVTLAGTPLCEIEIAAWTSSSTAPHVERAPVGEAGQPPVGVVHALAPDVASALPAVVVHDVVRSLHRPGGSPRDAHRWRPPRPS